MATPTGVAFFMLYQYICSIFADDRDSLGIFNYMKKEIKALNKFDLFIEMNDFKTVYPTVTYGDVYHRLEYDGNEYWVVTATV